MTESGLLSADGPLSLTQAVPGNLRTGPCGPVRPPYGRTEHGRSRGVRHRISLLRRGEGSLEHRQQHGSYVGTFSVWLFNQRLRTCSSC